MDAVSRILQSKMQDIQNRLPGRVRFLPSVSVQNFQDVLNSTGNKVSQEPEVSQEVENTQRTTGFLGNKGFLGSMGFLGSTNFLGIEESYPIKDFYETIGAYAIRKGSSTSPSHRTSRTYYKDTTAYDEIIAQASQRYGVSKALIKGVIRAESGFNPNAVSRAGAMGLMQLMPGTARSLGVSDPFNPEQNIDGGVRYLKAQLDRFHGDVKLALAAYNCGPGKVKKLQLTNLDDPSQMAKLPAGTQRYIHRIMSSIEQTA